MNVAGKITVGLSAIISIVIASIGLVSYVKATNMTATAGCVMAKEGLKMCHVIDARSIENRAEIRSSDEKREINQEALMREMDTMQARQTDLVTEVRKLTQ